MLGRVKQYAVSNILNFLPDTNELADINVLDLKFIHSLSASEFSYFKMNPGLFYQDILNCGITNVKKEISMAYTKLDIAKVPRDLAIRNLNINLLRLRKSGLIDASIQMEILADDCVTNHKLFEELFIWKACHNAADVYEAILRLEPELSISEKDLCKRFFTNYRAPKIDKKLDIAFRSERDIPLITQSNKHMMLTVEDYNKWYEYYVVEGNTVTPMCKTYGDRIAEIADYHIFSHCISPYGFLRAAEILGAFVDTESYKAVVDMFIEEYYDCSIKSESEISKDFLPDNSLKEKIISKEK